MSVNERLLKKRCAVLRGANAAGRMAHAMAHEISNPLETSMNLVYLIGQHPDTLTKNRERIKIAEHELDRVSHIVKQTLGLYEEPERSSSDKRLQFD
jgi:signal transduction histidine kinase